MLFQKSEKVFSQGMFYFYSQNCFKVILVLSYLNYDHFSLKTRETLFLQNGGHQMRAKCLINWLWIKNKMAADSSHRQMRGERRRRGPLLFNPLRPISLLDKLKGRLFCWSLWKIWETYLIIQTTTCPETMFRC